MTLTRAERASLAAARPCLLDRATALVHAGPRPLGDRPKDGLFTSVCGLRLGLFGFWSECRISYRPWPAPEPFHAEGLSWRNCPSCWSDTGQPAPHSSWSSWDDAR